MKFLKIFFICFILQSCGGPRAVYDYDENIDYSSYSSVALYPQIQTGLSQLDEKRLFSSVQSALETRNLNANVSPDLYLNIYTEEYQEPTRNSVGVGIGGKGRNVGVGVSGGIPLGGPERYLRLTFDLVDVKSDDLVWQAVVDSKYDPDARPEARQELFDKMVEEALKGYPPKR